MGYKNCCSPGYEVQHCLDCGTYNIDSHGDIGAFYNSITNADLPAYTTRFYHPSQHEMFSDLKYDKVELKYHDDLRDLRDGIRGPPIEAYIPHALMSMDTGSASPSVLIRDVEVLPKRTIVDEILRAQAEILGKNKIEPFIIRATEISQELHLKRTIRKIEVLPAKALEIFKKRHEQISNDENEE